MGLFLELGGRLTLHDLQFQGHPKRYMVLDGPVEYQPPEQKPYVALIAKKRSLDAPAKILLAGAEHLRNLQVLIHIRLRANRN